MTALPFTGVLLLKRLSHKHTSRIPNLHDEQENYFFSHLNEDIYEATKKAIETHACPPFVPPNVACCKELEKQVPAPTALTSAISKIVSEYHEHMNIKLLEKDARAVVRRATYGLLREVKAA